MFSLAHKQSWHKCDRSQMFSLGPGLIVQQFIEATAFVHYFSCQQVKTVTILTHLCIKHPRGWSNLKSHPHLADPSVAHSNFGTMWTESHERPLCVYRDRVESTHETSLFKSSFQAQKSSHLWQPILPKNLGACSQRTVVNKQRALYTE